MEQSGENYILYNEQNPDIVFAGCYCAGVCGLHNDRIIANTCY